MAGCSKCFVRRCCTECNILDSFAIQGGKVNIVRNPSGSILHMLCHQHRDMACSV